MASGGSLPSFRGGGQFKVPLASLIQQLSSQPFLGFIHFFLDYMLGVYIIQYLYFLQMFFFRKNLSNLSLGCLERWKFSCMIIEGLQYVFGESYWRTKPRGVRYDFLHFFLKRPINLKKFNHDKTFVLDDCKYLSKTFLNQHIFSIIIRSELELK